MTVGLYNHMGWFGEPENQLALIEHFAHAGKTNIGMVYNFHHGHPHRPRFPSILPAMLPHLLCVNLNGMVDDWEQGDHRKILPLGQGQHELEMMRTLSQAGWMGPIGLLNHTNTDSEQRLRENLEGYARLQKRLAGEPESNPQP